jgi:hypothetical protein
MSRLDEMIRNSPVEGGKPRVVRWLVDLFELWGGPEAAEINRRRQEIARLVSQVSGVTRGPLYEGEGVALQTRDQFAWHIRLAIMILLSDSAGNRTVFLNAARQLSLPAPSAGKPRHL